MKFTIALLISTFSVLSIGFLIASIVPTARFAQPIGAVIMYPMLAVCGIFAPIAVLPPVLRMLAKVDRFYHLRGVIARGYVERRRVGGSPRRFGGARRRVRRVYGALRESISMGIAQTSSPPFAAPGQRPTAPESAAQPPSPDQRAYRRREVPLHMDGYATYQALRFQQRLDSLQLTNYMLSLCSPESD